MSSDMIKIRLLEDITYKGINLKKGSVMRSKKDKTLREYVENGQAIIILGKLKTIKKEKDHGNS
mgnify:CR=1 FL=1